ncbi:response regulator [Oribacterium sp. P6A1]|uniref:response regulator n=1 Tax=Oribacterium sp. P6A1 TaxID=1410612 RepID=UPI00056BC89C|nr:response regulator transcription factor [Oribacterium sp. P6A1]
MDEILIYVVDDEKDIREMEKTFLENEGYKVETFANADDVMAALGVSLTEKGKEASSEIDINEPLWIRKPDLIIMDIMMPGTGGLAACSRIRKSEDTLLKAMPIILVSAKDTPLDRVTGLTMGSDDYLVKPFLPLELVARVKALLRRSDILRDQLLSGGGNTNVTAEETGNRGMNSLNGVKNSPDVGEIPLKCGNLLVNFSAHRVYVEESVSKPDKTGMSEVGNVENICIKNVDVQVTPMEFDFLHFIMLRKETAVSKAELLAGVWNLPDAGLQEDVRMTDDLVKRLRKKLRAAGSTARVETVWGFGYRMTEN